MKQEKLYAVMHFGHTHIILPIWCDEQNIYFIRNKDHVHAWHCNSLPKNHSDIIKIIRGVNEFDINGIEAMEGSILIKDGLPPLVLDCDKYGKISAHYYSVNSGCIEEVNGDFEFNTISEYTIIGNIYGQI
jgi:hypothetical protein